jgi:hypothetical protein
MKTKHYSILSAAASKACQQAIKSARPTGCGRSILGLSALLLVILFLSSPVKGQCPQGWNVSGGWRLKQSNQGVPNSLRLSMDGGGTINGLARYQTGGRDTSVSGSVTGRVSGNDVELVISWSNGLVGVYNGKIDPQGKITGTGYEKSSPSKKVSWFSDKAMVCGPAAEPSTDRRPRS